MNEAEVLSSLRPAVVVLDAWGTILQAHGGAENGIVGFALDEVVGRNALDLIAPGDTDGMVSIFSDGGKDVTQRFHLPFPVRLIGKSGQIELVEALTTRVIGDDIRWVVMVTPQSQQPITNVVVDRYLTGADAPQVAAALVDRVTGVRAGNVSIEAFVVHDPVDGVLTEVIAGDPTSPLCAAMETAASDPTAPWNLVDGPAYRLLAPADLPPRLASAAEDLSECDVRVLHRDGQPQLAVVLFGNEPKTLAGSARLVTDRAFDVVAMAQARMESLEILRRAAQLDPLTGLANRSRFAAILDEHAVAPSGVLYIDIDRFKQINDSLGHTVGDRILVEIANRISTACRPVDEVARLGGDEFAVMLREVDEETAVQIGARVLDAIAEPLPEGLSVDRVTASVGVAVGDGEMRELVEAADHAMLAGKRSGRNILMTPSGPVPPGVA